MHWALPSLVGSILRRSPGRASARSSSEIVEDFDGDTYRAVYTIRFREAVYVLHAFQKKSPKGIQTARSDVELVERRLGAAREDYEAHYGKEK